MADEIDQTDLREQHYLDRQIASAADGLKFNINGNGRCEKKECGRLVSPTICNGKAYISRWCDNHKNGLDNDDDN